MNRMSTHTNGFGLGPAKVQGADPTPTPGTHAAQCMQGLAILRNAIDLEAMEGSALYRRIATNLIKNLEAQLVALGYEPR